MKLLPHFVLFSALAFALSAGASPKASPYICVAKVDCGSPSLPSTQDLPSDENLMVKSASREDARNQCMKDYSDSYVSLARRIENLTPPDLLKQSNGCKIVSDAFPIESTGKRARAPAKN